MQTEDGVRLETQRQTDHGTGGRGERDTRAREKKGGVKKHRFW